MMRGVFVFLLSIFYFLLSTFPVLATPTPAPTQPVDVCQSLTEPQKSKCYACVGRPEALTGKSWTVLGCLSSNPQDLVGTGLKYALGIAGVLALFLIILAGFQMMTSSGDPEKLASGRDLLVSSIIGLLIIIFSVVILQIIGVTILQIPGFPKFGE